MLLSAPVSSLYAQNTTERPREPIFALHSENQSASDALLALSKAAHLNIIADTTAQPDAPLPVVNGQWSASLPTLVWDFGRVAGLSSARLDERSWVLWPRPDSEALARQITEGQSVKRLPTTLPAPDQNPQDARQDALASYLATVLYDAGWRADDPTTWRAVALSDLSPTMRNNVGARIQTSLLLPWVSQSRNAWLQDEFWEGASLRIATPPRPPANSGALVPAHVLEIIGTPPGGGIAGRSVGVLDVP